MNDSFQDIINSEKPVLIDFFATWCGPCQMLGPVLKQVKDSLGGFISMGKMFPDTFDWEHFWILTATISVILAFMNILPIPMLDGGYVVFLLYEMVRGKPVPDKVQQYAQSIGMFIILGLLLFANGMDVIRAIFH